MSSERRDLYRKLLIGMVIVSVYICLMTIFRQQIYSLFVRPVNYLFWYWGLEINSYPQRLFFFILTGLGVVLALLSLRRFKRREVTAVHKSTAIPETRLQRWLRWSKDANRKTAMGKLLAEELRELLMQVLAEQEGLPLWQIEAAVKADLIAAPPAAKMLIVERRLPAYARPLSILERLEGAIRHELRLPEAKLPNLEEKTPFDEAIREVIAYLEKRVEVYDE